MKKLNSGFSLIELLITTSVGLIVMVGMISLLTQQQKEIRRLEIKSELVDFRNELKMYLKSSAACKFNFENKTFVTPVTNSTTLEPNNTGILYLGENTSAPKLQTGQTHPSIRGLTINSVSMKNFRQPAAASEPNTWLADLVIDVKSSVIQFKPITAPITLSTTTSGTTRQIADCATIGDLEASELETPDPVSPYNFGPNLYKRCVLPNVRAGLSYYDPVVEMRTNANGQVEHRWGCISSTGTPYNTCNNNWRKGISSSIASYYTTGGDQYDNWPMTVHIQVDNFGAYMQQSTSNSNDFASQSSCVWE